MLKVNIFELAERQILREGKDINNKFLLVKYAIKIRKWIDKHSQGVAERIFRGDKVYQYEGKVKTYCRA